MTKKMATEFEERRLALQGELGAERDQAERSRMGQFATPTGLAADILRFTRDDASDADKELLRSALRN